MPDTWPCKSFDLDLGPRNWQILSAYFVVLPLRDEGAISLGLSNLPGLFVGSLLLTLIAAPVSTLIFSLPNLSKGKVLHCFLPISLKPWCFHVSWLESLKLERDVKSHTLPRKHVHWVVPTLVNIGLLLLVSLKMNISTKVVPLLNLFFRLTHGSLMDASWNPRPWFWYTGFSVYHWLYSFYYGIFLQLDFRLRWR